MKISKYIHSCILLEEGDEKLLIDPGLFSFVEEKVKPEDFAGIGTILITHEHVDHFYPEALKIILKNNPKAEILANTNISSALEKEGIGAMKFESGELERGKFLIQAISAEHGIIPAAIPPNSAFLINEEFLHPGDSLDSRLLELKVKTLALPISAPWLRLVDALAFAKALKPQELIPIHDGFVKDFFRERMYAMCENSLKESNISFQAL